MTRAVVTLERDSRASAALRLLQAERLRHAPVVDRGTLVGIVTDRDLLRVLPATVGQVDSGEGWDPPVERVMTTEVATVGPNDHVDAAARLLVERRIHGLPVVEDGELVGILTDTDLFRVFTGMLCRPGDRRLRLIFTPERADQAWPDLVRIAVACGLEVSSLITDELRTQGVVVEIGLRGGDEAVTRYLARLSAVGVSQLDGADPVPKTA